MNVCRLLGVVGSGEFHQAKHALEVSHLKAFLRRLHKLLQVLSGAYPEQFLFGGDQCVPMMEYQWEEYVENLRKVFTMSAYVLMTERQSP